MQPVQSGFEQAAVAEPVMALVVVAVISIIAVTLKWGLPQLAHLREKRLDIERYRIEVQERAEQALDDRERERIKVTQALTESQRQSNETLRAVQASIDASTAHTEVLVSELQGSRERSKEMGGKVDRIDVTTERIARQVGEVHAAITGRRADE